MALPAGWEAGWEEGAKRKQKRANGSNAREAKKRAGRGRKRGGAALLAKPGMKLREALYFYLQAARRDNAYAESHATQAPQIYYGFLIATLA